MLVSFGTLHYKVYLEVFAVPFFPLLFSSTLSSALSPRDKIQLFHLDSVASRAVAAIPCDLGCA